MGKNVFFHFVTKRLTIPPIGCRSLCTTAQKYDEAAKVQAQIKLLGECMRQHFQVVRSHVDAQLDSKITETGGSSCFRHYFLRFRRPQVSSWDYCATNYSLVVAALLVALESAELHRHQAPLETQTCNGLFHIKLPQIKTLLTAPSVSGF